MGRVLRMAPANWRFPLAVVAAQPRRADRATQPAWFDDERAKALMRILEDLDRTGTPFDVRVQVSPEFGAVDYAERGLILVGGHFRLNFAFVRWLQQQGHRVAVVGSAALVPRSRVDAWALTVFEPGP